MLASGKLTERLHISCKPEFGGVRRLTGLSRTRKTRYPLDTAGRPGQERYYSASRSLLLSSQVSNDFSQIAPMLHSVRATSGTDLKNSDHVPQGQVANVGDARPNFRAL